MKIRDVFVDRYGTWREFALSQLPAEISVIHLDHALDADQLYQALTGVFFGFPDSAELAHVRLHLTLAASEAPFGELIVDRSVLPPGADDQPRERVRLTDVPANGVSPVRWWNNWSRTARRIRQYYWSSNPAGESIERRLARSPLVLSGEAAESAQRRSATQPNRPPNSRTPRVAARKQTRVPRRPRMRLGSPSPSAAATQALAAARNTEITQQQTREIWARLEADRQELSRIFAELATLPQRVEQARQEQQAQLVQSRRREMDSKKLKKCRAELARSQAQLQLLAATTAILPAYTRYQQLQAAAQRQPAVVVETSLDQPGSVPRGLARPAGARWQETQQARNQVEQEIQQLLSAPLGPEPPIHGPTAQERQRVLDELTAAEPFLEEAERQLRAIHEQRRAARQTRRREQFHRARQTLVDLRPAAKGLRDARRAWHKWSTEEAQAAWSEPRLSGGTARAAAPGATPAAPSPSTPPLSLLSDDPRAQERESLQQAIETLRGRLDLDIENRRLQREYEQLRSEFESWQPQEETPAQTLWLLIVFLAGGLGLIALGLSLPRGSAWQPILVILGFVASLTSALIKISYDRGGSLRREHYEFHSRQLQLALAENRRLAEEADATLSADPRPLEERLQALLDQFQHLPTPTPRSAPPTLLVKSAAQAWEERGELVSARLRRAQRLWRQALEKKQLPTSMTPRKVFGLVRDSLAIDHLDGGTVSGPPRERLQSLRTELNQWRLKVLTVLGLPRPQKRLPAWRELFQQLRQESTRHQQELQRWQDWRTAADQRTTQLNALQQRLTELDRIAATLLVEAETAEAAEQVVRATHVRQEQSTRQADLAAAQATFEEQLRGTGQSDRVRQLLQAFPGSAELLQEQQRWQAQTDQWTGRLRRLTRRLKHLAAPEEAPPTDHAAALASLLAQQQQLELSSRLVNERMEANYRLWQQITTTAPDAVLATPITIAERSSAATEAPPAAESTPRDPTAAAATAAAPLAPSSGETQIRPRRARRAEANAAGRRAQRETPDRPAVPRGKAGRATLAETTGRRRLNPVFSFFVRQMTDHRLRAVYSNRQGELVLEHANGTRWYPAELSPEERQRVAVGLHFGQAMFVGNSAPHFPLIWRIPDSAARVVDPMFVRLLRHLASRIGCQIILITSSSGIARQLAAARMQVVDIRRRDGETNAAAPADAMEEVNSRVSDAPLTAGTASDWADAVQHEPAMARERALAVEPPASQPTGVNPTKAALPGDFLAPAERTPAHREPSREDWPPPAPPAEFAVAPWAAADWEAIRRAAQTEPRWTADVRSVEYQEIVPAAPEPHDRGYGLSGRHAPPPREWLQEPGFAPGLRGADAMPSPPPLFEITGSVSAEDQPGVELPADQPIEPPAEPPRRQWGLADDPPAWFPD